LVLSSKFTTLAHCTTTNPKDLTTIIAASKNTIFPFVIFPLPSWQHGFINTRFHTNYHMKELPNRGLHSSSSPLGFSSKITEAWGKGSNHEVMLSVAFAAITANCDGIKQWSLSTLCKSVMQILQLSLLVHAKSPTSIKLD
jgi:hypothetical protein